MDKPSSKYLCLLICLVLAVSTLTVYWQLHSYNFTSYDDGDYVENNEQVKAGLTRDSIVWAFTTGFNANWHPLTWLSLMLDCQLFGVDPGWHHLINLFLHIANALLLFVVLKQMTGSVWRSAFVAAAFALHPLHVESVAWISERKDVLSTLFWILTMGAYLLYAKRPGISRYLLVLLTFALGLMAKPMLVTLPFVLLLLDYWPLGRLQTTSIIKGTDQNTQLSPSTHFKWRIATRLLLEKVPLIILSAISSVVTFFVQGEAKSPLEALFLSSRIANSLISYVKYIGKMIWPSRLAIFYPHPFNTVPIWQAVGAALLLLAITFFVVRLARNHKYLPLGWLWYLGTLVPVIGLVQVGSQAMADRYSYIPLTGLFIIIAWGAPELLKEWRPRRTVLGISALVVLLGLSICTYFQLRYWRNGITTYERVIEINGGNAAIHRKLALVYSAFGKFDQFFIHLEKSLQFDPYDHKTLNSLAWILATAEDPNIRDPNAAIKHAEKACEIDNYESASHLDTLAAAYAAASRFPEAIIMAGEAIQMATDGKKKEDYKKRLEMYEEGKPYIRYSPKTNPE